LEAKNNHQESVVIPKALEPILDEMELHNYNPDLYLFGRNLQTDITPYVNQNHISARYSKFIHQLHIDSEKGLYSWKHTGVCKYYYLTGKDVYALMRQLRHRDLNTTMIYLKSLGLIQNDAFRNAMVA
jgi:integrase